MVSPCKVILYFSHPNILCLWERNPRAMALAGFSWTLSGYMYISTGIVTLACCILLSLRHRNSQKSRFPPGPFSLPIVGTLPFLGRDIRVGLKRLSQRYGPVVTVYLGSRRVVILNSYDAIKEAFVTHGSSTCGRPQDLIWIKEFTKGMGKQYINLLTIELNRIGLLAAKGWPLVRATY